MYVRSNYIHSHLYLPTYVLLYSCCFTITTSLYLHNLTLYTYFAHTRYTCTYKYLGRYLIVLRISRFAISGPACFF